MVEDPIPAGTEFMSATTYMNLETNRHGGNIYFTRREMHDDRMAIFQTYSRKARKSISTC